MGISLSDFELGAGASCERILRALPGWFGIEAAIVQYVQDIDGMPTLLARDGDQVIGFLASNRHFPHSAEIHVMAILPAYHRHGIGRQLVVRLEDLLTRDGVRWLQVKTLSPARENEEYRGTRKFYASLGFEPHEEFKTLWGEANPCLQMLKWLDSPREISEGSAGAGVYPRVAVAEIRFDPANPPQEELFQGWGRATRLEERTCRPVVDGRRVPPSQEIVQLACFLPGEGVPCGRVTVFDFNPRNRSAEFGFLIDPARRGTGCGTRMIRAFLDHAFPTWNLNRLYCQTGAFNIASVRMLERLRFVREAILRQHHELDGRLLDDLVYSLLRSEWKALGSRDDGSGSK